jgi:hypothetical protein
MGFKDDFEKTNIFALKYFIALKSFSKDIK